MNRMYSLLEVKSYDDDQRVIEGWATTPSPDRQLDIVESLGVTYKNPVVLLHQHDHKSPVGTVTFEKPTKDGVRFRAVLPKIVEPGPLKDRVDTAWGEVKAGIIRGVSIGFRVLDDAYEMIKGGGIRYLKTEVMELSLVSVPAQADAVIQTVKSIDTALRAASGTEASESECRSNADSPGVSGTTKQPAKSGFFYAQTKGKSKMNIKDQIDALEAKRVQLSAERTEIQTKAVDDGRTKDATEQERFAEISSELNAIAKEVADLRVMEKDMIATAKAVDGTSDKKAAESRGTAAVSVKNTQKLEPGIAFARAAKCLALGHLEHRDAIQIAKSLYDGQDSVIKATSRLVTKAAVAAGTTTDPTWAGALVGDETSVFADFVEYLRPQTILGRFGQGGVPGLRRVPFRVPLVGQTSGGDGYWVGEGQAKPLTKFDFNRTTLEPLKVANIAVVTMEVVRDSSPAADAIIRDQLVAALRARLDIDFINPSKAAVSGVSPASILNGVTAIPSAGVDADAVRADIRAIFGSFIAANNAPTSGVWVMQATTALALSLMNNPLGQAEFPGISMTGGVLFGLPAIVSENVPVGIVALVNASDIYVGDEDGVDVSMSTEASLQMDNSPDNPTTASTVLVSLWQRNLVGFRAERAINWSRRRDSAVAYLSGVEWGGEASS